jgi:hypothetical protein
MGSGRNPSSIKPDLFSAQQLPDSPSLSATETKSSSSHADELAAASSPSYALPQNLPSALSHLDDNQLDRLVAAVLAEQQRRGKKFSASDKTFHKLKIKEAPLTLTVGKLNAIRATFKAGVTPEDSKEWVVADAVLIEPVSTPKFPANREKNREFCEIAVSGAAEGRK